MKYFSLILMLGIAGCCEPSNEKPVKIAEMDGCVVYRINQGSCSNPVYTTVCPDRKRIKTTSSHSELHGKIQETVQDEVETVTK